MYKKKIIYYRIEDTSITLCFMLTTRSIEKKKSMIEKQESNS